MSHRPNKAISHCLHPTFRRSPTNSRWHVVTVAVNHTHRAGNLEGYLLSVRAALAKPRTPKNGQNTKTTSSDESSPSFPKFSFCFGVKLVTPIIWLLMGPRRGFQVNSLSSGRRHRLKSRWWPLSPRQRVGGQAPAKK